LEPFAVVAAVNFADHEELVALWIVAFDALDPVYDRVSLDSMPVCLSENIPSVTPRIRA
jgi:hypothetical protein